MEKQYQFIIWGASSFVGYYVTERLLQRIPQEHHGDIAIAGRSIEKLKTVNKNLNVDLDILVGDANDVNFITNMVSRTQVVISTVGPYALYGELLVKQVAEQGKDYCDLTGEPQWIWEMLNKYQDVAKESGARIVNCCGFDSIPSDVGVYVTQQKSLQQFGEPSNQIHFRFKHSRGGLSGGTIATMIQALKDIKSDKTKARILKTPYALIDEKDNKMPYQPSVKSLTKDKNSGEWLVPFIMASINTKIVHRTNYLLNYPWGKQFLYDESMSLGKGIKGFTKGMSFMAGLTAFFIGASYSASRNLLQKYVLAKPGEGPDEDTVRHGFFSVEMIGYTKKKGVIKTKVKGQGDPGYGSTAKMMTELAMLLNESYSAKTKVGFLTPVAAFENEVVDRLTQFAEITID